MWWSCILQGWEMKPVPKYQKLQFFKRPFELYIIWGMATLSDTESGPVCCHLPIVTELDILAVFMVLMPFGEGYLFRYQIHNLSFCSIKLDQNPEVEGQRPVFWINERLLALASTQQLEPGGFGEKPRESRTSQSLFFKNFCKLETGSCLLLTSMTSHLPTSLKTQTLYCYLTSSFAPVMIS